MNNLIIHILIQYIYIYIININSGTWSEDEDILGQSPQPQSQSAYSPSQKQPPEISVRKGNTVRLNSTSSGSNSGKALLALKSQKYFDMNNNRNNAGKWDI